MYFCSCCGAGTAADTEMTTKTIASQLELHRLQTGRVVPVVAASSMLKQMLFRYQVDFSMVFMSSKIQLSIFTRDILVLLWFWEA